MTEQVNATNENGEQLSDEELYDLEWENDEETDQTSSDASPGNDDDSDDGDKPDVEEKAVDDSSAESAAVSDAQTDDSPEDNSDSPAEGVDEDIWANATDAQKAAFLKAQNDFKAMVGRHGNSEKSLAALQKELGNLKRELSEATREKGTYETENPELFSELTDYMKSQFPQPTEDDTTQDEPTTDTTTDEDSEEELVKTVLKTHPDAMEIYNSNEWAEFTANMSVENKALYDSPDPQDFIKLLHEYKTEQRVQAALSEAAADDGLDDAVTVSGGSGSQADKATTVMNDDDGYDKEWAKED